MSTEFEFDVFLSHNSEDKPAVELVARRLKSESGLNPFLDKWNLTPGKTWPSELEDALERSATTAVFLGSSGKGPWHDQELQRALVKAVKTHDEYRIIPVLLPGADDTQVSGFLGLRTWVDFRAGIDSEEAFERLVGGIRGEAIDVGGFELPDEPAPYRGLSRFEKEQSDYFFGRDDDIDHLVARLRGERFAAVVGASGSGKSSLVRAGLLPRLDQGALPGSEHWRVVLFLPGSDPLRALANQLASELSKPERKEAADKLVTQLGEGERCLRDTLVSWYADAPAPLLLVIDQFEELFTQCNPGGRSHRDCRDAVRGLVAGVADLVRSGDADIRVLITLRADFLDRCLEFPVLRDLLQDRQLLLGELGDEALREAIVLPVQKVGAFFEKGLVDLILKDVTGERGSLPLLQHALFELWKARRGPWLTQEAYEQSGGVTGALKRFAQAIYDGLKADEQAIARNIFVRITSLGDGVSDTRRRVPRDALYAVGVEPATVDRVIDRLSGRDARLIVAGEEGVEVTHEALLQEWDTLRSWLNEDRDAQRVRQRISEAAQLWVESERQESDLYTGGRLELAEQWETDHPGLLNESEQKFLEASRRKRQALERHQRNRLVGLAVVAVVMTVLAVVVGIFWDRAAEQTEIANAKTQEAKRERNNAERAQRFAEAGRLAALSQAARFQKSPRSMVQTSVLLAVEAALASRAGNVRSIEAEQALRDAIATSAGYGLGGHRGPVNGLRISQNGRWLVTLGGNARLWDLSAIHPYDVVYDLAGQEESVSDAAISSDSRWLVTAAKKTLSLWDLSAAEPASGSRLLRGHEKDIRTVVISPDDRWLVSAGWDGVRVWDLQAADPSGASKVMPGHSYQSKKIVFAGHWLVTVDVGTLRFWRMKPTGPDSRPKVSRLHTSFVQAVDVSPDGRWLVTGSQDKTARVWDLTASDPTQRSRLLGGHEDSVHGAAFTPNGNWLVTGAWHPEYSSNTKTRLWDLRSDRPFRNPLVLEGHERYTRAAAISFDGRWLATGGNDATVRVWDLDSPTRDPAAMVIRGHEGAVRAVAFSQDGRWLVTGSSDDTARIWSIGDSGPFTLSRVVRGHEMTVGALTITPDSRWLITASGPRAFSPALADKTARLIRLDSTSRFVLPAGARPVGGLAVSADGRMLITAGGTAPWAAGDETPRLWDLRATEPSESPIALEGHKKGATSVAISPNGRWLVTGSADGTARLWDLSAREPAQTSRVLSRHTGKRVAVAISRKGDWIATAGLDPTPQLWRLPLSDERASSVALATHKNDVSVVAFGNRGRWLATGGPSQPLRLWDLHVSPPAPLPEQLPGQDRGVSHIAFSDNDRWLAATATTGGGIFGQARLWNLSAADLSSREPILIPDARVNVIAFSPDGRWLSTSYFDGVIGTADTAVRLWDLETPDPWGNPRILRGPEMDIRSIAFNKENDRLVAASMDGGVYVWDLGDAILRPVVIGRHPQAALCVLVTPDNRWVVSGSLDGTARLWPADVAGLVAEARRVVGRNLMKEEWDTYFPERRYRKTFDALPEPLD